MGSSLLARLQASFILFFLWNFLCMKMVSCMGSHIAYGDHCGSIAPESTITSPEFTISPFPESQTGYFYGEDRLFKLNLRQFPIKSNIVTFRTLGICKTDLEDVFKIEANLIFQSTSVTHFEKAWSLHLRGKPVRIQVNELGFNLEGFWSRATGKLCMVGWSFFEPEKVDSLNLAAILKLNNVMDSSTMIDVIMGTFGSLHRVGESDYFETISLLMFPEVNYKYTSVSKESDDECSGRRTNVPENLYLRLPQGRTICSLFHRQVNLFELEYGNICKSTKNCNLFGDGIGYFPQVMSLSVIQCSKDGQSLRFLVEFPDSGFAQFYHTFNFSTTLVAEGSWDEMTKQLYIVACRIFNASTSLENAEVGDCTIKLSLRFPEIWSIRKAASILGEIWSSEAADASTMIAFSDAQNALIIDGFKYEYTELDKLRKSFPKKNSINKKKQKFPEGNSRLMSFDMLVKSARGKIAWGFSFPLSVGDQPFQRFPYLMPLSNFRSINSAMEANTSRSGPVNISYQLSFTLLAGVNLDRKDTIFNLSSDVNLQVQITSEGVYDDETGHLSMVGCRSLRLYDHIYTNESMDCEILVNIQFPPLNSKKSGSVINGNIESKREESDPFYFEPLYISGAANYNGQARDSIWRMDLESIMAVLSNTLACILKRLQILHVKKHPGVLPSISLLMLVILSLWHLIPLLLNFEALFLQKHTPVPILLQSAGWLEVNEVSVRIIKVVAFLLQCHLLQLTWMARRSDEKQKSLWSAEKKGLLVCLSLYVAGCSIAFMVKSSIIGIYSFHSIDHHRWFNLGVSRVYAGLIVDSFLLPQILFNIFQKSRENALSHSFCIGITIIRLLPHGYDLYREHYYVQDFAGSYIFADPSEDFYTTTWNYVIIMLGLFSAAIVYLQQKFGGGCFIPQRFQNKNIYEKVTACNKY